MRSSCPFALMAYKENANSTSTAYPLSSSVNFWNVVPKLVKLENEKKKRELVLKVPWEGKRYSKPPAA